VDAISSSDEEKRSDERHSHEQNAVVKPARAIDDRPEADAAEENADRVNRAR
jgi:hypothetical protein